MPSHKQVRQRSCLNESGRDQVSSVSSLHYQEQTSSHAFPSRTASRRQSQEFMFDAVECLLALGGRTSTTLAAEECSSEPTVSTSKIRPLKDDNLKVNTMAPPLVCTSRSTVTPSPAASSASAVDFDFSAHQLRQREAQHLLSSIQPPKPASVTTTIPTKECSAGNAVNKFENSYDSIPAASESENERRRDYNVECTQDNEAEAASSREFASVIRESNLKQIFVSRDDNDTSSDNVQNEAKLGSHSVKGIVAVKQETQEDCTTFLHTRCISNTSEGTCRTTSRSGNDEIVRDSSVNKVMPEVHISTASSISTSIFTKSSSTANKNNTSAKKQVVKSEHAVTNTGEKLSIERGATKIKLEAWETPKVDCAVKEESDSREIPTSERDDQVTALSESRSNLNAYIHPAHSREEDSEGNRIVSADSSLDCQFASGLEVAYDQNEHAASLPKAIDVTSSMTIDKKLSSSKQKRTSPRSSMETGLVLNDSSTANDTETKKLSNVKVEKIATNVAQLTEFKTSTRGNREIVSVKPQKKESLQAPSLCHDVEFTKEEKSSSSKPLNLIKQKTPLEVLADTDSKKTDDSCSERKIIRSAREPLSKRMVVRVDNINKDNTIVVTTNTNESSAAAAAKKAKSGPRSNFGERKKAKAKAAEAKVEKFDEPIKRFKKFCQLAPVEKLERINRIDTGVRVAVYWAGDRYYYAGTVTDLRTRFHKKPFHISYDDGDEEWLDFADHEFHILEEDLDDNAEYSKFARSDKKSFEAKILNDLNVPDYELESDSDSDEEEDDENISDHVVSRKNGRKSAAKNDLSSTKTTSTPKSAKTSSATKSDKKASNSNKKSKDNLQDDKQCDKIRVGNRVSVFWEDDDKHYKGTVARMRKHERPHYIEYDDGYCEWIDLTQQSFSIIPVKITSNTGKSDKSVANRKRGSFTLEELTPASVEEVKKGSRIAVWWAGDEAYYSGSITDTRDSKKGFYVEYDDGDSEWIDLRTQKFLMLRSNKKAKKEKPEKETVVEEPEPEPASVALEDSIEAGTRIKVWWKDDETYYSGTVTKIRDNKKKRFYIEYDDGETEWIDLSRHEYKLLKRKNKTAKPETPSPKKSRRLSSLVDTDDENDSSKRTAVAKSKSKLRRLR